MVVINAPHWYYNLKIGKQSKLKANEIHPFYNSGLSQSLSIVPDMEKSILALATEVVCLPLIALIFLTSFKIGSTDEENMKASIFRTYTRLGTFFAQDFDFDIRCGIQGYEVIYQASLQDPIVMNNQGSNFSDEAQEVIQRAKAIFFAR